MYIYFEQKAKSLLAKKEEGNKEFRAGSYQDAYKTYTEALEIDPNNKFTNSKLYCNRATVCSKVSHHRNQPNAGSGANKLGSYLLCLSIGALVKH